MSSNEEGWIRTYWRPAIAWSYFAICLFDFLIMPAASMWWFNYIGEAYVPWNPVTLKEGGLYHLSMGAIVGVTAWKRGEQKIIEAQMSRFGGNDNEDEDITDDSPKKGSPRKG